MTKMREGRERMLASGNRAGEHGYPDGQVEEAPVEEWLDVILRPALKLALGDEEPTAADWTRIRETLEARHQGPFTGEEE